MTYKEVIPHTEKTITDIPMVRGVARARWEGMGERGELKFDGKMRIVVNMIYKVAYIIEF